MKVIDWGEADTCDLLHWNVDMLLLLHMLPMRLNATALLLLLSSSVVFLFILVMMGLHDDGNDDVGEGTDGCTNPTGTRSCTLSDTIDEEMLLSPPCVKFTPTV